MNISRNGKVARLPRAVRDELNERLADGETARSLTTWLNELPVVQGIVAREFGGRVIREQNVSEWKRGGYEDWLLQQEARGMVERFVEGSGRDYRRGAEGVERGAEGRRGAEVKGKSDGLGGMDSALVRNEAASQPDEAELRGQGRIEGPMPDGSAASSGFNVEPRTAELQTELRAEEGSLTEALVWWVTARLAVEMREIGRVKKGSERWRVFGAMCDRVMKLRRGDQQERRLVLAGKRLEAEREKKRKATEAEMMAWAMREENRRRIASGYISRADKIALIHKAYFADVEAEPEPEIFVRERREKAVALAKEQVGEGDPGFEWYVEELVTMWKREDDARCGRGQDAGMEGGSPPRSQDAEGGDGGRIGAERGGGKWDTTKARRHEGRNSRARRLKGRG